MEFIDVIQVSICGRCSLNCVMCGQPKKDIFMDELVLNNLNRSLLEFKKPPILALAVRGEPLSHPFFNRSLGILSKKSEIGKVPFKELYIDTNGKHLNYKNSLALLEVAEETGKFIRLTISMDGATKGTYNKIRKGGDFNQLIKNCEDFLKLRNDRGLKYPALNFQFIVMEENIDEVEKFKKLIEELLGKYEIVPKLTGKYPENDLDSISFVFHHPLKPNSGNLKKSTVLHRKVLKKFDIEFPETTKRKESEVCVWPFYMVVVRENGDILPCCLDTKDEMIMGNIREKTLNQILKGDNFSTFRLNHIKFKDFLPLKCKNCKDQLVVERADDKIDEFLNGC